MRTTTHLVAFLFLGPLSGILAQEGPRPPSKPIDWTFEHLDSIGGHKTNVVGSPRQIDSPQGPAVEFDGHSALFLDTNPLAGLDQFTAEVIFRPTKAGPKEQRFVHVQEDGSENRLLFELRLADGDQWFLDTFIKSGTGNYTLFAEKHLHPVGPWYHAAVVMNGQTMRHYVNGTLELSTPITFTPQGAGKTSLGVRQNKVSWYVGAIRRIRLTPRVLDVSEFLFP